MAFVIHNVDQDDERIRPGSVLSFTETRPLEVREVLVDREDDFRFQAAVVGVGVDERWFIVEGDYCKVFDTPSKLAASLWGASDASSLDVLCSLGWLALDDVAVGRAAARGIVTKLRVNPNVGIGST